MSIVTVEHYPAPSTVRAARWLEGAGSRAVDHLAGRTVWCASSLPAGREAALALSDCLLWAGDGGVASSTLGTGALEDANVRPDDVVVVHDPLGAALAQAIRERGAHLLVRIRARSAGGEDLLPAVDAYLASWTAPARGIMVERIAALVPCSGAVAAMDVAPGPAVERRHDLGWSSALGVAVTADRADTVGGTRHARPRVASR